MTEMNENPAKNELVGLATKVWVKDTGELIFEPSNEDPRYPFMPTVSEVLVGYCIESDLEVPEEILETLPEDLRKFVEKDWHLRVLKERKERSQHQPLVKGSGLMVPLFGMEALKNRGLKESDVVMGNVVFQKPIFSIANDTDLQRELKERLPENLGGILGKTGFNSYLLS